MKPVIGITCNYTKEDRFQITEGIGAKGQEWNLMPDDYVSAVERAGGIPILIPCTYNSEVTKSIIDLCDGILFSGGNDIDPLIFNMRADDKTGIISEIRDSQEIFAIRYILNETDKPVLGICRGLQLINIALGGNLYLDVKTSGFKDHSICCNERYKAVHKIEIMKDTILYKIFNTKEIFVNSMHHQAVYNIAENFTASAFSEDGIIEAIEYTKDRFVLAVQWHPEMMSVKKSEQQKIFDLFIKKCKSKL